MMKNQDILKEPSVRCYRSLAAFALIELLVAIGIIAVLIGILIPVVTSARRNGRDIQCASNMREICLALISYAGQNKGAFPPNNGQNGQFWYLESLVGPYLTAPGKVGRAGEIPPGAQPNAGLAGGVFVCPNDLDDAVRSYSMNLWASGDVSSGVRKLIDGPNPPGRLFKLGAGGAGASSSRLMLLLESWSELPISGTNPMRYAAQAIVGLHGTPGERFGANKGIGWKTPPDATPGRFKDRDSQITFYRHDPKKHPIEQPRGRCNFGFADGHVSMLCQDELVDPSDKRSSYVALWSPMDRETESSAP
jgi:prepilin-type processing-associated H-X9-DG protein